MVKLASDEAGKAELEAFIQGKPQQVSSLLARAEARRAVRRLVAAERSDSVLDNIFARMNFLPIDRHLVEAAGRLEPPALRSLDAIHLASALSLGADLDALVTYDRRLARAAVQAGIRVFPEPSEN